VVICGCGGCFAACGGNCRTAPAPNVTSPRDRVNERGSSATAFATKRYAWIGSLFHENGRGKRSDQVVIPPAGVSTICGPADARCTECFRRECHQVLPLPQLAFGGNPAGRGHLRKPHGLAWRPLSQQHDKSWKPSEESRLVSSTQGPSRKRCVGELLRICELTQRTSGIARRLDAQEQPKVSVDVIIAPASVCQKCLRRYRHVPKPNFKEETRLDFSGGTIAGNQPRLAPQENRAGRRSATSREISQ